MTFSIVCEHLFMVISALLLSLAIGLPLGILAYSCKKTKRIILSVIDIIQTIPSLALLGIIMVFLGAGKMTVIMGITLYSLLPIVRNTELGLSSVDEGIKESARGMGMGRLTTLFKIELPLALPTILTGIRIAIINAVGTAVFAAFVGGGGLGAILTKSIRVKNIPLLLAGTGVLILISFIFDFSLGWLEGKSRTSHKVQKFIAIPVAIVMILFCCLLPFATKPKEGLLLYDGDYSETQIMNRIIKDLIEDRSDLKVTIQDQMSQVNNFKALKGKNNSCDMMISYDGTLLTTFLGMDPSDVPEGTTLYDFANSIVSEKYNMRLLSKLGFNNTYCIAVSREVAEKYNLNCISDLEAVAGDLKFGAEHEFFTQAGSMKFNPFVKFYNLDFKDVVSVDRSLKYNAAEKRSFDVTVVYATDGLNQKAGLKVLDDDKHFFPEYNGAFLVREDTFEKFREKAPDLEEIINLLENMISNEDMVQMTYDVDVLGKSLDDVAREFLISRNLISQ